MPVANSAIYICGLVKGEPLETKTCLFKFAPSGRGSPRDSVSVEFSSKWRSC